MILTENITRIMHYTTILARLCPTVLVAGPDIRELTAQESRD
jgi:hypothetical protein